jgi:hypothetical protein
MPREFVGLGGYGHGGGPGGESVEPFAGSSSVFGGERQPFRMSVFKKGGKVRGKKRGKSKVIKAHVGERVLTAKQNKKYEKKVMGRKRSRGRRS